VIDVVHAVAQLRHDEGIPVDPTRRGPVMLDQFFETVNVRHVMLSQLTMGRVSKYLQSDGVLIDPLPEPGEKLAGFLFYAGPIGIAFVEADDILPRRRFTAAHELGHASMHQHKMGKYHKDDEKSLLENDVAVAEMEREANAFAAEILMPREICSHRAAELKDEHGVCPRIVLAYRLASELLVSREAMRYRLRELEIGDE